MRYTAFLIVLTLLFSKQFQVKCAADVLRDQANHSQGSSDIEEIPQAVKATLVQVIAEFCGGFKILPAAAAVV